MRTHKTTQKQTALDLVATQGRADFVLSARQQQIADNHRLSLGNHPTPQQIELFQNDPLHYGWAEQFFGRLPKRGAEYFRKLYNQKLKKHLLFVNGKTSGGYYASQQARQYTLDVLMPRIDRVLAQYSHIVAITDPLHTQFYLDTLERPTGKNAFVQSHRKALFLYTKKEIDKLFSIPLATFFTQCLEDFASENAGKVEENEMWAYFLRLYRKIGCYCANLWLALPHWAKVERGNITLEQMQADIARACDVAYWNKRLHKAKVYMAEHIAIATGQVNKQTSAYLSEEALLNYQAQKRKNNEWIKNQILINIDDPNEQAELVSTYVKSQANPEIRRKELMNKLRGVEEYAQSQGDIALFLTLTAPSSFHAYHSKGGFNEKWQSHSPKATQKYLCQQWAKMRSAWGRAGISFYGMRVVEPHHDGTPHWHILTYIKPKDEKKFTAIFRDYALEVDGDEQGAKEHRCKVERCDPKKGTATGYITKYISKNINGYALDGEFSDETGETLKSTAFRASGWASLWRIRQFQDFGVPPISVWRELRRLGDKKIVDDEEMELLRLACDSGQFAEYIQLQGGTDIKRADLLARLSYDESEQNAYFETRKKVEGVYNQVKARFEPVTLNKTETKNETESKNDTQGGKKKWTIKTRLKRWKIARKPSDWSNSANAKNDKDVANKNSTRSVPWTCVNNCTDPKQGKIQEFLKCHAEEVERLKFSLNLRQISSKWITDFRLCRLIQGEKISIYANMHISWNGVEVVLD